MTHILSRISPALFILIGTYSATCLKSKSENIGNIMAPMVMGAVNGLTYNGQAYGAQLPHIAVKILPSKKLRLTPTEMNTLLFSIKREIHNKINKLEEELYEHRHDNEKHLSTWALNQAPVYMPFHESVKKKRTNYQKTLTKEVEKLKNKFEGQKKDEEGAEKEAEDGKLPKT